MANGGDQCVASRSAVTRSLASGRRAALLIAVFLTLLLSAGVASTFAADSGLPEEGFSASQDLVNTEAAEELPLIGLDREEALEVNEEVFGTQLEAAAGP